MRAGELQFPSAMWLQIVAHAEQEYPRECCGLVLARSKAPESLSELIPCENAQDKYHRQDPGQFPRTSANGYFIDPAQLLAIEKQCRNTSSIVRVIYHSHPDAAAYFSAEDNRRAMIEGRPLHPHAAYLVLSVQNGRVVHHKTFHWQPDVGYLSPNGERARP